MESIVLGIHTLLAIGVIGLVLLQQGKGADAGAAFGSGSSSTVFGSRGSASFFTRMTTVFAVLFFVTSIGLAFIASQRPVAVTGSVVDQIQQIDGVEDSAVPAAEGTQVEETDVPATE